MPKDDDGKEIPPDIPPDLMDKLKDVSSALVRTRRGPAQFLGLDPNMEKRLVALAKDKKTVNPSFYGRIRVAATVSIRVIPMTKDDDGNPVPSPAPKPKKEEP